MLPTVPPEKENSDTLRGPGFAAFIDLHDSTYAWDQNADTAAEMIRELYSSVEAAADKHSGHVGNFTGDGFLLLFTSVESSILCLSRIIQDWEKIRVKYIEIYSGSGVSAPDGCFLALRTGISFGNFGPLAIKDTIHYSGSGINKAQRCEAASKDYFRQETLGSLKSPNYVFIDSSAENLIQVRSDFSISEQLPAQFKGYFQGNISSEKPEFESRKQFIYAIWPKKRVGLTVRSGKELAGLAFAQTRADIGDRLMSAAQTAKSGSKFHQLAESATGKTQKRLFDEAVAAYKDALGIYTLDSAPFEYALTQSNLGHAMGDHAELLMGEEKKEKLQEAVAAYREALRILTLETAPEDYAMTQTNLGHAMEDQADLLTGEEKTRKLDEAIAAYREALRVRTIKSAPAYYAMTQNNLGDASTEQAALVSGEEKDQKLAVAKKAYAEALRVYTETEYPERRQKLLKKIANLG